MLSKKEFKMLIINGILVFLVVLIFAFIIYMRSQINNEGYKVEENNINETKGYESQAAMSNLEPKIQRNTEVMFEVKDQLDLEIKTETYEGGSWSGLSKKEFSNLYPDYTIERFEEDKVKLSKVIERDVTPKYVLTQEDDMVIIQLEINGTRMFYEEISIGQHDFSDKLQKELDKGILLTDNQKKLILENEDELYKVLQEYDE